jgi:hypothetical protein
MDSTAYRAHFALTILKTFGKTWGRCRDMHSAKSTITIEEGIHLPLEFCGTCPYRFTCPSVGTDHIKEKNIRTKKLFECKDFISQEISKFYNIPKLPIFIYDNPHTMYEKLGFFLAQIDYDKQNKNLFNAMFSNPIVIIKTKKGVNMQSIHENVLNILIEKIDSNNESE